MSLSFDKFTILLSIVAYQTNQPFSIHIKTFLTICKPLLHFLSTYLWIQKRCIGLIAYVLGDLPVPAATTVIVFSIPAASEIEVDAVQPATVVSPIVMVPDPIQVYLKPKATQIVQTLVPAFPSQSRRLRSNPVEELLRAAAA